MNIHTFRGLRTRLTSASMFPASVREQGMMLSYRLSPYMSNREIGRQLSVDEKTVRRWLRTAESQANTFLNAAIDHIANSNWEDATHMTQELVAMSYPDSNTINQLLDAISNRQTLVA